MSAKSFFKSTAFKCIVVLLSIVLLCSVFLTICNALFYVSDEERLNRALSELYDGESVTTELAPGADALGNGEEVGRAVILAARTVTSDNHAGDWLIQVKGLDGYQSGTVTCWVVIETQENAVSGVGAVSISSNEGQSYIGKITQEFLNGFSVLGKFHGRSLSRRDDLERRDKIFDRHKKRRERRARLCRQCARRERGGGT